MWYDYYQSKPVKMTFTARLTGNNEIPPVNTPATGIARFELSSDGLHSLLNLIFNIFNGTYDYII